VENDFYRFALRAVWCTSLALIRQKWTCFGEQVQGRKC
jgi:hypothetical protein